MNRELLIEAIRDLGCFACETGERPTGSLLFVIAGAMQATDYGLGDMGLGESALQATVGTFLEQELNKMDKASERHGVGH